MISAWGSLTGTELEDGGVYAQTLGPRFETPAEVKALAEHADMVGMTLAAETVLAGEAALAYAAVCTIDNLANGVADKALTVDEYRRGRDRTAADAGGRPRLRVAGARQGAPGQLSLAVTGATLMGRSSGCGWRTALIAELGPVGGAEARRRGDRRRRACCSARRWSTATPTRR